MTTTKPLPWEESAHVVTVTGWACKTCRKWWGDDEHMARWCCSTDQPCECGGRKRKSYTVCDACLDRKRAEQWAALYKEAIEWDGQSPLACWNDSLFFWSVDDLINWLDQEEGRSLEDLRLVLAEEWGPRHFSLGDFLEDYLPEDFDGWAQFEDIDRAVNERIQAGRPWSYTSGNKAVTLDSVKRALGLD